MYTSCVTTPLWKVPATRVNFSTACVVERTTRQLGQSVDIEGHSSGTAQRRAGKLPKLTTDAAPAVFGQDVNNIDLDRYGQVVSAGGTATNEPHDHAMVRAERSWAGQSLARGA